MIFEDNKELSKLLKIYDKSTNEPEKKMIKKKLIELSSFIALDTETTGTNHRVNQLIEIGFVILDKNYKITKTMDFKLKRDEVNFPEWNNFAETIHGISEKSLKESDGIEVFDMDNILKGSNLTKKEVEILDVFKLLEITRPEFQAWNVTFDYKFFDQFLHTNNMGGMDKYFSYSPFDMKTYVKPSIEIGRIDLNVLIDEFPTIFKEGSRMIDNDGNVKVNMNSVNMYFGCNGQYDKNHNSIHHSAIEDIFKSVVNVIGASSIESLNNRNSAIESILNHDFYSPTFQGKKMELDTSKSTDIKFTVTKENNNNPKI